MKKVYTRMQGNEWHSMKHNMTLLNYKINKNGRIKGFYKDRNGALYIHWMNDQEIKELRETICDYYHFQKLIYEMVFNKSKLIELREYIDTKIQKSFDYDFGRSDKRSDRLMTETVIELQLILEKIDEII